MTLLLIAALGLLVSVAGAVFAATDPKPVTERQLAGWRHRRVLRCRWQAIGCWVLAVASAALYPEGIALALALGLTGTLYAVQARTALKETR